MLARVIFSLDMASIITYYYFLTSELLLLTYLWKTVTMEITGINSLAVSDWSVGIVDVLRVECGKFISADVLNLLFIGSFHACLRREK